METNIEQAKEGSKKEIEILFRKNLDNIDGYFSSKLVSSIISLIITLCLVFLPFITLGGFKSFSEKYSLELTSSERREIKSLFKEQEKKYENELKELEDKFGDDFSDLLEDGSAFSNLQIEFWFNVENVIDENLSYTQRTELIESYLMASEGRSIFNIWLSFPEVSSDDEKTIEIIFYVASLFVIALMLFAITSHIQEYLKKGYNTEYSLFMEIYSNSNSAPFGYEDIIIMALFLLGFVSIGLTSFRGLYIDVGVNMGIILIIAEVVILFIFGCVQSSYIKNIKNEIKIMKAIKEVQTHKI